MSLALTSLLALVVIIVVSCLFPRINPGLLAIIAALIIGTMMADMTVKSVFSGFPAELFLLLVCVCLVFGMAQANGTLPTLVQKAVPYIKGRAVLVPVLLFFVTFVLSAMGPGNIAAVALIAAIAMSLAARYHISPLLTAIIIVTGANAGAFSPFAPTGVIAIGLMQEIGLDTTRLSWVVFIAAAVLQSLTALGAYSFFLFRWRRREAKAAEPKRAVESHRMPAKPKLSPPKPGMALAGTNMMMTHAGISG